MPRPNEVSHIKLCLSQGVVTYMSPVEVFVTAIKMFDRQKVCLIAWSFPSEPLDHLIFRVKGQIAATPCWFIDFSSSEVTLIPWSAPKKSFDHLIQFWSWLQMLLHRTCKWLSLVSISVLLMTTSIFTYPETEVCLLNVECTLIYQKFTTDYRDILATILIVYHC